MTRLFSALCGVAAAMFVTACTVNQTEIPDLTGPSTYARAVNVTATPDTIFLNGQQSVVAVEVHDASGAAFPNVRLHLDVVVNNLFANCGRLSQTEVTTGSDGRATVIFTTPALPLPLPECGGLGASGGVITIAATPVGTNFQTSKTFTATIATLTPSTTVTATSFSVNFTMTPNPGAVNVPVTFDASPSVSPGHSITSFAWTFDDGGSKSGRTVTHDFGTSGIHTVTLTITDDAGQSGSKSGLLTIN
jgi:hypothetical protein